ncbi:MAG: SOS response-associated peptidase [Rhodospirillaceae bacterium]
MCVALAAHHTWQAVMEHYALQPGAEPVAKPGAQADSDLTFTPSAVIRPKAVHPIIRETADGWFLDLAIWGLPGSKGRITPVTNARCETLDVMPMFRDAFQSRRCAVPVSGYYEWKRAVDGTRTPWKIWRQNDSAASLIAIAGLYTFNSKTKQCYFVVVTTEPNEVAAEIHDRMPVILTEEGVDTWLSLNTGRADLRSLCKPYDGDDLTAQSVAKSLFERSKADDKNQLNLAI